MARPGQRTARDWLEELLGQEGEISSERLEQLVTDCPKEGLFLDYKAGELLRNKGPRAAAAAVREYVAGFANAEGGLLVLGFKHSEGVFDDAEPPGGGSLSDWAARACTTIGADLHPPPRFLVGTYDGPRRPAGATGSARVLVVAVSRSDTLVRLVVAGRLVYHFRLEDQTIEAPEYLVADLVLGRRNRPVLALTVRDAAFPPNGRDETPAHLVGFASRTDAEVSLSVVNDGLVFADDVRCGVVGWMFQGGRNEPSRLLRSMIRVLEPEEYLLASGGTPLTLLCLPWAPRVDAMPVHLGPTDTPRTSALRFKLPRFMDVADRYPHAQLVGRRMAQARGRYEARMAVYVASRNAPPAWWQLVLRFSPGDPRMGHEVTRPAWPNPPEVSFRFLEL